MAYAVPNKSGFTLIELLVVGTISMVLTGFVMSSYSSFNRKEKLRQAAKTLKTDLRFAQNRAASGVKPPVNCPTLLGYELTIALDGKSYTIQARCSTGLQGPVTTVALASDISVSSSFTPILFTVLTGTIARDTTFTLSTTTVTGAPQTYQLNVFSSGDVNDASAR